MNIPIHMLCKNLPRKSS